MLVDLPIGQIVPNPHQPRKTFDPVKLRELAKSIRVNGLLQPITVDQDGMIVAGERRWRACRLIELPQVPCNQIVVTDTQRAVLALVENAAREPVSPIEEAVALRKLMHDENLTRRKQLADLTGLTAAFVSGRLRLLQLSDDAQAALRDGLIKLYHARAIADMTGPKKQALLLKACLDGRCSTAEDLGAVAAGIVNMKLKVDAEQSLLFGLASLDQTLQVKLTQRVEEGAQGLTQVALDDKTAAIFASMKPGDRDALLGLLSSIEETAAGIRRAAYGEANALDLQLAA